MGELWPGGRPAAVTLTFDGGYRASVERALPLLAERAVPSTWFLVANSVGRELEGRPVADWSVWAGLDPAVVEIGNHSMSHPLVGRGPVELARRVVESPGTACRAACRSARRTRRASADAPAVPAPLGTAEALGDFAAGKRELEDRLGRAVPAFAYPNGRARGALRRGVAAMGHTSARTSIPGPNRSGSVRAYGLRAETWTESTTVEEAAAWLQRALDTSSWLVEVLHVVDRPTGYPWTTTPERLEQHLGALRDVGVWIATQTQVIEHLRGRTSRMEVG